MKKSYTVALSGTISALSIVFLFCTAFVPFAEYTLPAIAGALFIALVIELGYKYAFTAFLAVGFISLFIVPSKEASILFVMFFGYYPIVKGLLERLRLRTLEWIFKIIIFNAAVFISYFLLIKFFVLSELTDELSTLKFGVWGILLLGNIVFIVYDIALSKFVGFYTYKIRPMIKKRTKK